MDKPTRYEQGFIKKAAALGYDGAAILKKAQEAGMVDRIGNWLSDADKTIGEAYGHAKRHIQHDPVNYLAVPGVTGALAGGLLGNTFGGDDPRKRRLRTLLGAALGATALTAANSLHAVNMPKFVTK